MARLSKAELIQTAKDAIENAGWDVEILSERGVHPAELRVARGGVRHLIRLYIWNLSHGGKSRSEAEFRIQVKSGVTQFVRMTGERTLILGWDDDLAVFAAYDYNRHARALGSSPSLQISIDTLRAGADRGLAARTKRNKEIVVAVRPDFLASYVEEQSKLHDPVEAQATVEALRMGRLSSAEVEIQRLERLIRGGAVPRFGARNEQLQRRVLLNRLARLRENMDSAPPGRSMIGHNRPPPEDEDIPTWQEVQQAAKEVAEELSTPKPNLERITARALIIEKAGRLWKALKDEAQKLGTSVVDAVREKAAEGLTLILLYKVLGGILTWLHVTLS